MLIQHLVDWLNSSQQEANQWLLFLLGYKINDINIMICYYITTIKGPSEDFLVLHNQHDTNEFIALIMS